MSIVSIQLKSKVNKMGKAKLAEKDIKKGRSSSPQVEKKIKSIVDY